MGMIDHVAHMSGYSVRFCGLESWLRRGLVKGGSGWQKERKSGDDTFTGG
jgi:hypothetical protein